MRKKCRVTFRLLKGETVPFDLPNTVFEIGKDNILGFELYDALRKVRDKVPLVKLPLLRAIAPPVFAPFIERVMKGDIIILPATKKEIEARNMKVVSPVKKEFDRCLKSIL